MHQSLTSNVYKEHIYHGLNQIYRYNLKQLHYYKLRR